jgi:hypothetical protein
MLVGCDGVTYLAMSAFVYGYVTYEDSNVPAGESESEDVRYFTE